MHGTPRSCQAPDLGSYGKNAFSQEKMIVLSESCIFRSKRFAKCLRARSRLYRFLRAHTSIHFAASLKLYKIYVLFALFALTALPTFAKFFIGIFWMGFPGFSYLLLCAALQTTKRFSFFPRTCWKQNLKRPRLLVTLQKNYQKYC